MAVVTRLLAALVLCLAVPVSAKTWKEVFPIPAQRTLTVASDGVTVLLTPQPYPDGEDPPGDSYEDVVVDVQFPGMAPFRVPRDDARESIYGISVGIGRLARGDASPVVMLSGYSGGAHCCSTMQVVSLVDGQPIVTSLPMMDGEIADSFPRDLDGDGTVDLRWSDDSLLYAFTSYAGSWPVPRFYNLRRGELVDVSRQPGFAREYRNFAREALRDCRKGDVENTSACAAYAYAMAILGQAEEGIRTAADLANEPIWYPFDCTVEQVNDECPEGKERTFAGYEEALRWIMRKNGYLPEGASPPLAH